MIRILLGGHSSGWAAKRCSSCKGMLISSANITFQKESKPCNSEPHRREKRDKERRKHDKEPINITVFGNRRSCRRGHLESVSSLFLPFLCSRFFLRLYCALSCRVKDKPFGLSFYLSPDKDKQNRPKAKLSSGKTRLILEIPSCAPSPLGGILPSPLLPVLCRF